MRVYLSDVLWIVTIVGLTIFFITGCSTRSPDDFTQEELGAINEILKN